MVGAAPPSRRTLFLYGILALLFLISATYRVLDISEAMNTADQEWGEDRLIEALLPARSLAPPALISRITAAADAFVGDAPQHDDMTLVVARCC